MSRWEAAGAALDSSYASAPHEFYTTELSRAPGWKVGGWTRWGLTDPIPRLCPACGTEMDPLLTIATSEWDSATGSWAPEGHQARDRLPPGNLRANYTMIVLARGYDLQLQSARYPRITRTSS